MIILGIDVGGTFTDLVLHDAQTGQLRSLKTPTTPSAYADGVLNAIRNTGMPAEKIDHIVHGMTVATNTALEMNGARLGVITTRGFRDVLIVGRGNRTQLYDIKAVRPPPLVERARVLEVDERITATGEVYLPLNNDHVASACEQLMDEGVEAIAICFLHSYANPDHERRAAKIVQRALPNIPVSISSNILPEYREFERFSTTALNAYVGPKVSQYLGRLSDSLAKSGIVAPLRIMGSNGGTWSAEAMSAEPVNAMLSGPAGGVTASIGIAKLLGLPNIITYDMGGTSTDACLIRDYEYNMTTEGHVGMWPNRASQIEIKTVGAGGGSIAYIAYIDPGKFLNVGPRSAGAAPGPACYGKGGTEPTVTDANVILGRFRPDLALWGEIKLDEDASLSVVSSLGDQLELSPERMAEGIIRLAVARMTATVKEISVMRGLDPRDFTLFAYGGAGPLHAADIAEELGITRIVIPPMPGTFSAFGLLTADTRYDITKTRLTKLQDTDLAGLEDILEPMRAEARDRLHRDGFEDDDIRLQVYLDMRFVGQAFELTTPMPDSPRHITEITEAFQTIYEERYAQKDRGPCEIVSFRVVGFGNGPSIDLPVKSDDAKATPTAIRPISFESQFIDTPIYQRAELPTHTIISGPAVIEEDGATTVVPPKFTASVDNYCILTLMREGA